MKKLVNRLLGFMLAIIIGLNINTINSHAEAYVSISVSSTQLSVGESVSVSVSVSGGVSAYTLYVSYDSSVLDYSSCSGSAIGNGGGGSVSLSGTGEGTTTISFVACGNGSSYVGTSGEAYDINGDDVAVSNAGVTINVGAGSTAGDESTTEKEDNDDKKKDSSDTSETSETTTEKDDKSADCNLSSLEISPGTLQPAFSPDITSYYVNVEEDVKSMYVTAIAADSKAETAVYGSDVIEKGENTVKINVTAENGAVKVYYIRVVAGKDLGDASATINNIMYRFINDSSKLEIPEGYSESSAKYMEWDVLAYEAPNKRFKIVCLVKEDDKDKEDATYEWFIINETTGELTPYFELSSHMNKYIIIPKPAEIQIPENFVEDKITIGQNIFTAYKSNELDDKNISLVYAMNINGEEGFYMYDSKEVTFMRYIPMILKEEVVVTATADSATTEAPIVKEEEDTDNSKTILLYSTIALGILFALMTIWLISTKLKKSKMKDELRKAEDMVSQLAAVNTTVNKDVLDTLDTSDLESNKKKDKKNKKSNNKSDDIIDDNREVDSDSIDKNTTFDFKEVENKSDSENIVNNLEDSAFSEDTKTDESAINNEVEAKESVEEEKSLFDDDKELQDIMDMVISEVKQSGIKNDVKVEPSDSHGNTKITIGESYNAENDSAFIDDENK